MFDPKGSISRRRAVLDALATAPYDTVVTYSELSVALGGASREIVQKAVHAAKAALEREHNKSVDAVPNEGYRVIKPSEHLTLAQRHQRKSRRSLTRAQSTVTHVDLRELTEGERAAVTIAATSLSLQLGYMRRNDIRVSRLERAAETAAESQQRSDEEIAELKARLERLESA